MTDMTIAQRRQNKKLLRQKLEILRGELAPILPLPEGPRHPDFPRTFLAYHLLTEDQLDDMAHYYQQSTPGPWTHCYPVPMYWDKDFLAKVAPPPGSAKQRSLPEARDGKIIFDDDGDTPSSDYVWPLPDALRIAIKKRKFGDFIGLGGCKTPTEEIDFYLQYRFEQIREEARLELADAESNKHVRRRFY